MGTQFIGFRPETGAKLYRDSSSLNGRLQYVYDNSYSIGCSGIKSAAAVKYGQLVWFGNKKDNVVFGAASDAAGVSPTQTCTIPAIVAYSAGDTSIQPTKNGEVTDISRVKLVLEGFVEYSTGIEGVGYDDITLGATVGYNELGGALKVGATHVLGKVVAVNPEDKTFVIKFSA